MKILVHGIVLLGIFAAPLRAQETEVAGLKLEVVARISAVESVTTSGSKLIYDASAAYFDAECALENVSDHPIELPSRPENNAIAASGVVLGKHWIAFRIFPLEFAGKPTVVSPVVFVPVTLLPGERVKLPRYHLTIKPDDWRTARMLQQVKVEYDVNPELAHRFNWWSGKISATYPVHNSVGELHREEEIPKETLGGARESNTAAAIRLIQSADHVVMRRDIEPQDPGIKVNDTEWLRRLGEALTPVTLANPVACMCCGWETAYFFRDGQEIFSLAAIHGNQLRIYGGRNGGDFGIPSSDWARINAILREKFPPAKK